MLGLKLTVGALTAYARFEAYCQCTNCICSVWSLLSVHSMHMLGLKLTVSALTAYARFEAYCQCTNCICSVWSLLSVHSVLSQTKHQNISRIWGSHGGDKDDRPDDGGSKDLWNVGKLLSDYTALQPRREQSSKASEHLLPNISL
jgi:hypothetical protein